MTLVHIRIKRSTLRIATRGAGFVLILALVVTTGWTVRGGVRGAARSPLAPSVPPAPPPPPPPPSLPCVAKLVVETSPPGACDGADVGGRVHWFVDPFVHPTPSPRLWLSDDAGGAWAHGARPADGLDACGWAFWDLPSLPRGEFYVSGAETPSTIYTRDVTIVYWAVGRNGTRAGHVSMSFFEGAEHNIWLGVTC